MLNKIWKNRVEFYPYLSLLIFWYGACFNSAILVKNQPGIMALGLVTVPPVLLIILAIIKTYREISSGSPVSLPFQYAHKESDIGKKIVNTAYIVVFMILMVSTYLHHFQPQVLRVPSNSDVTKWQDPAFEHTLLYNRITEDEKQKILKEGVPPIPYTGGDSSGVSPEAKKKQGLIAVIFGDIFTVLLGLGCFVHARKHYGYWLASCFLIGSFVFTGLTETSFILSGRFFGEAFTGPLGVYYGSYWFTKGGLWFFETPLIACLGWYFIAYSCVLIAGKMFTKTGLIGRAAIGALIAVLLDLWQDPAITSPESMAWVWAKGGNLLVFGIPLYNFVGWFLLIFLFAIYWEKLLVFEEKYGREKATVVFFAVCVLSFVLSFVIINTLWLLTGVILWVFGAREPVYIPPGW